VDEVRSFLGLAGYYRRFIRNFSHIAHAITSLQRKGKKFEWIKECTVSFKQLKHLLTNTPILKITYPNKELVVCIDACNRGLGGVPMQEGKVVCYESRKLNEHEQNYVTHNLESTTIIHALKMWRQYLLGRRFIIVIDQSGLRYLFDQPNLNTRQARWLATLSEFDFEIKYIKGKENRVVDALSKRV